MSKIALEMVTQGELPEVAASIRKMLVDCMGVDDSHVVIRQLHDTKAGGWFHVYAPVRKAVLAHALIAAYRQGRADAYGNSELRITPRNPRA